MDIELGVGTAIVLLTAVLVVSSGGSLVAAQLTPSADVGAEVETVTLADGTVIWPYTSRAPATQQQTLSVNVVIYGDTDATRTVLRDIPFGEWGDVEEDREDLSPAEDDAAVNETLPGWGAATGAERWIWIDPPESDPGWVAESYQLEDGDYLGDRHHLRAYEAPEDGNWTAIQVHTEHWDWFHLRHTVHSIAVSQQVLEEELWGRFFVADIHRERFGNAGSADADGWVTIVTLDDSLFVGSMGIVAVLATGLGVGRRTQEVTTRLQAEPAVLLGARALIAVLAIVLMYHTIRFGAIGIERHATYINPKLVVGLLYPVLVIGLPVVAYLTSRPLDGTTAFAAVTLGFIMAIFIDYTYLGVLRIPLDTFVHRAALAVGIGLIGAGASATSREPSVRRGFVRTGVLVWVTAVALPLMQFVPLPLF